MNTIRLLESIAGCVGASVERNGRYRLDFQDGTSRLATDAEVLAAETAEAAAKAESDAADAQQGAGIVEAKRAYARLQAIIDGADTATLAQLRTAMKEMARDVQHLIRAAVR